MLVLPKTSGQGHNSTDGAVPQTASALLAGSGGKPGSTSH